MSDLPPKDSRRDPDSILIELKKKLDASKRGRLKIFLGMAAGVGKTFEMLTQAHRLKKTGVDLVIGVVETHGRAETESLTQNLEIIPRFKTNYRGTDLDEMDLDAILKRRPEYVLVDELAHTNIPGSRHEKRYQDVLELLDAGIHVFTTVNVQHIESRKDTVQSITGITIREAVPDSILDAADDIELVDLPPNILLERLAEGKVYTGEKAKRAADHFFQVGNLTALRELALRLTAERVDNDLLNFKREKQILSPWKTAERLMVAIGASPSSEQLIRWTRKTAYNLEAPWVAVYVETNHQLSEDDKALLTKNIILAEELGAEVVTTVDVDVPRALLRVARQRNISQIVVGKPVDGYWKRIFGDASPIPRLIRESGAIDIYIVDGGTGRKRSLSSLVQTQIHSGPKDYLISVATVIGASILCSFFLEEMGYSAIGLILLFTILVQGLYSGRGPLFVSATLGAFLWDYLFIPPRFTLVVHQFEDVLLLIIFFVGAIVTGTLGTRLAAKEKAYSRRDEYTSALYNFSRELAQTRSLEEIILRIVQNFGSLFSTEIAVFVRQLDGGFPSQAHDCAGWQPSEKERTIAQYAFDKRKMAGKFTDTLRDAEALHVPLMVGSEIVGVLSVKPRPRKIFSVDQLALLEAFSNSAAVAIQKELLKEGESRAKTAEESERLHKILLNSISHELRTPLTAITGSASSLKDPRIRENQKSVDMLIDEIAMASERLNRLVENLLKMSRLESGHLQPHFEWCEVSELLSVVIQNFKDPSFSKRISLSLSTDLPLIQVDFLMTELILNNLIHNALVHSPPESSVQIEAIATKTSILILVKDSGKGISEEDLPKIFDKFYRSSQAPTGGTGLGLSIAKGFAEAQHLKVSATNRSSGGAEFVVEFPILSQPDLNEKRL